ncbi:MAG: glycosyltransferase family 39 protein [Actinomycetota bacterium]|nr:glycosyltransferase family 39 protein [Actinomycetota bacterium]
MVAPWIMVDELVYSELAKSFAETGRFAWRDEPINAYGPVYPLFLSPAYFVHEAVPSAYAAAKAMNALLMTLAAVPAYAIARRVVSSPLAVVAAVLAVSVPSMLYTGTLMTENAFYPAFLLAAYALVAVLERPTALHQVLLLAAVALAYATRVQAIALVPAIVTAPLLLAWLDGRGWRSLGAYRVLWTALGAAVVLVVGVQFARGRSLEAVLGAYEAAGDYDYAAGPILRWLLYHVAGLDLYLGVVPFAAFLLLLALGRRLDRSVQVLLAATTAVASWLVLEVAAFASLPTVQRIEERNMFYVAPLFFAALLAWIERGAPRPRPLALAVAAVAAVLPALIPYTKLIGVSAQSDTLALLPWWWLQDHVIDLSQVRIAALVLGVALGAAFLLVPRRLALALPVVVLLLYAVTLPAIENGRHGVRMASLGALFQGITTGTRDWVDRAVGSDAEVAFLWSGRADAFTLWQNEFFNRSVGPVYELANPLGGGLPSTAVAIAHRDGLLRDSAGRTIRAEYVLTDEYVPLAGRVVARDRQKGMLLLRTPGPLRATHVVSGLYPGDTWSRRTVTYERLRCRGGAVAVAVMTDGHLFPRGQAIRARRGRVVVATTRIEPDTPTTLTVPLRRGPGGRCRVDFVVSPTAVPAQVLPGSTDTRRLGAHFGRFLYLAP